MPLPPPPPHIWSMPLLGGLPFMGPLGPLASSLAIAWNKFCVMSAFSATMSSISLPVMTTEAADCGSSWFTRMAMSRSAAYCRNRRMASPCFPTSRPTYFWGTSNVSESVCFEASTKAMPLPLPPLIPIPPPTNPPRGTSVPGGPPAPTAAGGPPLLRGVYPQALPLLVAEFLALFCAPPGFSHSSSRNSSPGILSGLKGAAGTKPACTFFRYSW
mmetsp:Transcript_14356/g.35796  ORF Transcript_14356/g.35796 Transcript_14356/m.35796 type:complete len:215 (-) Transcript_14356:1663-2307(-)